MKFKNFFYQLSQDFLEILNYIVSSDLSEDDPFLLEFNDVKENVPENVINDLHKIIILQKRNPIERDQSTGEIIYFPPLFQARKSTITWLEKKFLGYPMLSVHYDLVNLKRKSKKN